MTETLSTQNLYTAADSAAEFNISRRTIRFYEAKGLLQSERKGRFLYFDYRQRARLIIILRSKRLGITLGSTQRYLDLYDEKPDSPERMLYLLHESRSCLTVLREQQQALMENIQELENLEHIAIKDFSEIEQDVEAHYADYLASQY